MNEQKIIYIILPGQTHGSYSYPELLVAKQKTRGGKNWYQAHEELHKEGQHMLTIRQFIDFISHLKLGNAYNGRGSKINKTEIDSLLDEILTQRDPWRAEWLDADFKVVSDNLHINYNHRTINGQLKPQNTEPLADCLMEDCQADIFGSANYQGLPTRKGSNFYYYCPMSDNNSVAWFRADSVGVGLSCSWYPQSSGSALGVRAAKQRV